VEWVGEWIRKGFKLSTVRVRQHVNPLGVRYKEPVASPDWSGIYKDLSRPFHLDIGSAHGHFLFAMAQQFSDLNFLGLEIRQPLVDFTNEQRDEQALDNLHFIFCSANSSLRSLLSSLPTGALQYVTIQFPDPWFKRRHRKRRVVQPELVELIAQYLAPGGLFFLQSDIEEVAFDMRQHVRCHDAFIEAEPAGWYPSSPFLAQTEREVMTTEKGGAIYRSLFTRRQTSSPNIGAKLD